MTQQGSTPFYYGPSTPSMTLGKDTIPDGNIVFHTQANNTNKELLRISMDGITANPDVPVDEAATRILETLNDMIKTMIMRAWVKLDDAELRECYSLALQYDVDLATLIQKKFIEKNEEALARGDES